MSLAILFHFLCVQHVSDINISIIRSLQAEACASACNTDTTQTQPHKISNTRRTENETTDVVVQQHNRKFLMVDILMSKTCWVHKKWNKIASDIELVFHSSTVRMLSRLINGSWYRKIVGVLCRKTSSLSLAMHCMKACRVKRSIFPVILNLALDEVEWSTSIPGCLTGTR